MACRSFGLENLSESPVCWLAGVLLALVVASQDVAAHEQPEAAFVLAGHGSDLADLSFSPDGSRLLTASSDKTAKVWDVRSGKELLTLAGHGEGVRAAAFSPDGQAIASASKISVPSSRDRPAPP